MSNRFYYLIALFAVAAVAFSWYITPWEPAEADTELHAEVPAQEAQPIPADLTETTRSESAPETANTTDPRCPHTGSDKS